MSQDSGSTDIVEETVQQLGTGQALVGGAALLLVGILLMRRAARHLFDARPAKDLHARGAPFALVAAVFALMFCGMVLASLVVGAIPEDHPLRERELYLWLGGALLTHLVPLLGVGAALRVGLVDRVGLGLVSAPPLPKALGVALLFYLAVIPAFLGATSIESGLYSLFGADRSAQQAVEELASDPTYQNPLVFLIVAGAIPCFEELFFRGVLLSALLRRLHPWRAVVLSAVFFSLLHDAGSLPILVLGVALGYLFLRTRSLLAPFLFHALHNSVTLAIIFATGAPPS